MDSTELTIDNMADAFAEIERHALLVQYMQMQLGYLRELAEKSGIECRTDVLEFLQKSQGYSDKAVICLTSDQVSFLVDGDRNLLEFA